MIVLRRGLFDGRDTRTVYVVPDLGLVWGVADDHAAVEIAVSTAVADSLPAWWPPMGLAHSDVRVDGVQRHVRVWSEGEHAEPDVIIDGQDSPGGWERLESELALFAAERLANVVAIHAALIVHGGHALLVPGASHTGKSTLCVAAAAAGAQVLSDEYALVDPVTGWVTGWRRAVKLRRAQGVERLDLTVASDPVPVGLVALVSYESDVVGAGQPIPASELVLGLMANTVCARSRPDEALDAALAIARSAQAVGGSRGDAASAIAELLALLDSDQLA